MLNQVRPIRLRVPHFQFQFQVQVQFQVKPLKRIVGPYLGPCRGQKTGLDL